MLRGSFDQPSNPQNAPRQLRPGTSGTGICCLSHQACRLPPEPSVVRAFKPAVCQPSKKSFAAASTRHSGHRHLLLEPSSLPLASKAICCSGVQDYRLPAFKCVKCVKCSPAASTSLQTPTILRGSFDQSLWPQAFVVRAFNPAVCLQSHLLLGRSSLPFASLQMHKMLRGRFDQLQTPKMPRGSFDQALWP